VNAGPLTPAAHVTADHPSFQAVLPRTAVLFSALFAPVILNFFEFVLKHKPKMTLRTIFL
jgi:hypothetical protein